MRKKGYLFILDAIVSLMILTIGVSLILSYKFTEPATEQAEIYSNDIVQFLTKIKVKDLNNQYIGINGVYVADGEITNIENTIIEQVAEFYYRSEYQSCAACLAMIKESLASITKSLILDQYNFEIIIDDSGKPPKQLYINSNQLAKENAQLVIPIKRITHGVYNNTLYGPYIMEIVLWQ